MLDRIPNILQVLNMAGLLKVLNKTLHYRYLIGFWYMPLVWNCRVTESYEFCVNCILEIQGILNMFQVFNIQDFEYIRNLVSKN